MNEYRCTRQASGIPDLRGRNGTYIRRATEQEARLRMAELFPEDLQAGFGFDIELWKINGVPVYEDANP